jgi:hypothetical protein
LLHLGHTGESSRPNINHSRWSRSKSAKWKQRAEVRQSFFGMSMEQLSELADSHAAQLRQLQHLKTRPGELLFLWIR